MRNPADPKLKKAVVHFIRLHCRDGFKMEFVIKMAAERFERGRRTIWRYWGKR